MGEGVSKVAKKVLKYFMDGLQNEIAGFDQAISLLEHGNLPWGL